MKFTLAIILSCFLSISIYGNEAILKGKLNEPVAYKYKAQAELKDHTGTGKVCAKATLDIDFIMEIRIKNKTPIVVLTLKNLVCQARFSGVTLSYNPFDVEEGEQSTVSEALTKALREPLEFPITDRKEVIHAYWDENVVMQYVEPEFYFYCLSMITPFMGPGLHIEQGAIYESHKKDKYVDESTITMIKCIDDENVNLEGHLESVLLNTRYGGVKIAAITKSIMNRENAFYRQLNGAILGNAYPKNPNEKIEFSVQYSLTSTLLNERVQNPEVNSNETISHGIVTANFADQSK